MSSSSVPTPRREKFADACAPSERFVLDLLLAQDGSTTRLCETVAGGPIAVQVRHQQATERVPQVVRDRLPGQRFLERITSLVAHDEVLMDNLVYVALDGLEPEIATELLAGTVPIGHLLARWWVRRERLAAVDELCARLWGAVGSPDPQASRGYVIATPEGARMVIAETFRRGMLMTGH